MPRSSLLTGIVIVRAAIIIVVVVRLAEVAVEVVLAARRRQDKASNCKWRPGELRTQGVHSCLQQRH